MILPEADAEEATHQVGKRSDSRLAQDHDGPPITVSSGIAVYPADGDRKEALVSAADHVLYQVKDRSKGVRQTTP
jgi:GGDEF domain-containing protein